MEDSKYSEVLIYNFETKKYRVSMYPGKKNIEIQLVNN